MLQKIGITVRYSSVMNSYRVAQDYVDAVTRSGGLPLLLPFGDLEAVDSYLDTIDGLLLTGGEDIYPPLIGATGTQDGYSYFPTRDEFEIQLAQRAIERDTTVLGICRGCQILYAATGGHLIADIPKEIGNVIQHRRSLTESAEHPVQIFESSILHETYKKDEIMVVSYHHQGLNDDRMDSLPWKISAKAPDRGVEAIEHKHKKWCVGVLWHPEMTNSDRPDPIIQNFVEASA